MVRDLTNLAWLDTFAQKENTYKMLVEIMLTMMLTMVFMLTAINLVPTTSREMAKTIMKMPWAPIPVTSLPQLGLNRVYIALELAFLGLCQNFVSTASLNSIFLVSEPNS